MHRHILRRSIAPLFFASLAVSAWLAGCGEANPASGGGGGHPDAGGNDSGAASAEAGSTDAANGGDAEAGTSRSFVGAPTITAHDNLETFLLAHTEDGRTWAAKPGGAGGEWGKWSEVPSLATIGTSPELVGWSKERLDVIARGPCGDGGETRAGTAARPTRVRRSPRGTSRTVHSPGAIHTISGRPPTTRSGETRSR